MAELQCWNKATKWEPHDMFLCEPMPLEATADVMQACIALDQIRLDHQQQLQHQDQH